MSKHEDPRADADLRALLHETADQVTPHGTLDEIRSRTERPPVRRWAWPALAAAAVLALVVGGIGWMLREDESPSRGPVTSPTTSPTSDVTTTPLHERAVPVYYAGNAAQGIRLFREFQNREVCEEAVCSAKAAVALSLSGTPSDPDYRSLWPSGVALHGVEATDDLITINLINDAHDRPAGMSEDAANLAVQQLIYSAQAGLGKGRLPVQLLIDGKHTDTVLGVPASEPLSAASAADVLAPVQISSPANGARVPAGPVKVEGLAATFEANVVWEVMAGGDAVVKDGFTTAAECCTLSPYSFTVTLEPGTYTIVAHDSDESGEGRPVNSDSKEIIVE